MFPPRGKRVEYDDTGRQYRLGSVVNLRIPPRFEPYVPGTPLFTPADTYQPVTLDQLATATMPFSASDHALSLDEASWVICRPLALMLAKEINEAWPPGESLVVGDLTLPSMVDEACRVKTGRMSLSVVSGYDVVTDRFLVQVSVLCGVTGGWSLIPKHELPRPILMVHGLSSDALLAERFALQTQLDRLMAA